MKMLVPISKILLKKTKIYKLYDVDTREVSNWTITEIKKALEAGRDIRSFINIKSHNLRLKDGG